MNAERTQGASRTLAIALFAASTALFLLLLAVVVPALSGRDPLGTGRLLGLSGTVSSGLVSQYEYHKSETLEFVLEPFQSLEYKYLMDRGSTMVFSWTADSEVYFDLQAQNTTVQTDRQSYTTGTAQQQMGSYQAAYNGMHGWFWENRGFATVTLRLDTAGFYVNATEYRGGSTSDRSPPAVF